MSDDLGDKISHLERVKAVLHKHFAYEIDAVIQKAIQNAAAELLNIIPEKYLGQLEKPNTPRGVKIDIDKVDMDDREYTFIITDWIAEKKDLPVQFSTNEIEDTTTKAILVKYGNREVWIPKSQIKAVYKRGMEESK